MLYVTVKVPPNSKTGTTPSASTVYENTASAVLTYADHTTADVAATGTLTTAAPVVNSAVGKTGPAKVAPGGQIVWRVSSMNTGNTSLANATLTDTLPTGLTDIELYRQYTGYQPLQPANGIVTIEFSTDGGSTWGSSSTVDAALTLSLIHI